VIIFPYVSSCLHPSCNKAACVCIPCKQQPVDCPVCPLAYCYTGFAHLTPVSPALDVVTRVTRACLGTWSPANSWQLVTMTAYCCSSSRSFAKSRRMFRCSSWRNLKIFLLPKQQHSKHTQVLDSANCSSWEQLEQCSIDVVMEKHSGICLELRTISI
jgi:hypothetical protein